MHMDGLYHRSNVLWVTTNRSRVKEEMSNNKIYVPPAIRQPAELLDRIRKNQTEASVSVMELVNGSESFGVYQVDAAKALQGLQKDDLVMLNRTPILIGFRTSQFPDVVEFHNPSDSSRDGKSTTYFLDRYDPNQGIEHRTDSLNFLMGGFRTIMFQRFDTVGNPPKTLTPGNEYLITNHHYDFHEAPEEIQTLLVREGFHFEASDEK